MATNEERELIKERAEEETEYEQNRIINYNHLKSNFTPLSSEEYVWSLEKADYPEPTKRRAKKNLHISILDEIKSLFAPEFKQKLEVKVNRELEALFKEKDNFRRKQKYRLQKRNMALKDGDIREIERYICCAIERNEFSLDCIGQIYKQKYDLQYIATKRTLVISYQFPSMSKISKIKSWKADLKVLEIKPVYMNQHEYNRMYEQVLFNIALRILGIIFDSEQNDSIVKVVFNGYVLQEDKRYGTYKKTYVFSAIINREKYEMIDSLTRCESKLFFSDCDGAKYIGNLKQEEPIQNLDNNFKLHGVEPIQIQEY